MTAALLSPAIAWQQISACTDRTLTITCEDSEVISYQDLIARAAACIPPLRRLDLKRGEPVLITAHTNLEFLSCFLGLMLHGAVPVPIPPREALKTTERFMTRLGPLLRHHRVLICTPAEHDEIRAAASTDCQISRFTALAEAGDEQFGRATAQQFAATFAGVGLAPTALGSGYGLAEATVAVSMSAPNTGFRTETHAAAEVVTGGRVLPGYEVRIDAAPGARAGTIKLRGDSVAAKAYVGGKKLDALDEEGFCDTHDLGFLVDDEIVILGRQDEVFIVHGENRFPYDIEFIIRGESEQHRTKVACFGVNERVVVVLESPLDSIIDKAEADRLRCQVVAATGLQLDELITVRRGAIPTTTSGKLKRRAVAQAYRDGTLPRLATHAWTADPDSAPKTTRSSLEGAH